MARLAPHLPHSGVGFDPATRRGVCEIGHEGLDLRMELTEPLLVEVQRVEQLTVDVELHLTPSAVADAHRARVAPTAQVSERALAEVVLTADPIHDLERPLARSSAG